MSKQQQPKSRKARDRHFKSGAKSNEASSYAKARAAKQKPKRYRNPNSPLK